MRGGTGSAGRGAGCFFEWESGRDVRTVLNAVKETADLNVGRSAESADLSRARQADLR